MKYTLTKADLAGWKLRLVYGSIDETYYIGERFAQGYVYKDKDAFDNEDGVCYVPECDFLDEVGVDENVADEVFEICQKLNIQHDYIALDTGYTRRDLDELTKEYSYSDRELFDALEWSSPQALLREWMAEGVKPDNPNDYE